MNCLILEGNSKVNFGGGQRITLQVIEVFKKKYSLFHVKTGESPDFEKKILSSIDESLKLIMFTGSYSHFLKKMGSIFLNLLFFPVNTFLILSFLSKNSLNKKNTIVYSATKPGHCFSFLLKLYGYKVIAHIHTHEKRNSVKFFLFSFIYQKFDLCLAVSRSVFDFFKLENSDVLYNPVDLPLDLFKREKNRGIINIGIISSLFLSKGVLFAIDNLKEYSNIHIHIAGEGPLKSKLEKYEHITLYGFVEDINSFYNQYLDIVLVPSLIPEAFGLVVVESIVRGLPVIASDLGGQKETLESIVGKGFTYPHDSGEGLRKQVQHFIDNQSQYRDLFRNASNKAYDLYSKEKFQKKLVSLLKSV